MLKLALSLIILLLPAVQIGALQINGVSTHTTVLYDGRSGGTPDEQGFNYLALATGSVQYVSGSVVILDTTADIADKAGYSAWQTLKLDRNLGYKVHFVVQVAEEMHLSTDRAGFSVLVMSDDLLGLELAFWQDEIWVQEGGQDDALFTHAESVAFDTSSDLVSYELSVIGDMYVLSAAGSPLLSGPLRDYTAFEGFPDPYELPGFLFMGDNSGRSAAEMIFAYAAVEANLWSTPTGTPSVMPDPTSTKEPSLTLEPPVTVAPHESTTPTRAVTITRMIETGITRTADLVSTPPASVTVNSKLHLWMSCLKGVEGGEQK